MSSYFLLKKQHQTPRTKGQAMVEFALVFPIFLLLVLGVIELGHLIFIYSSVYVSSREAARYGAAAGTSGSGVAYYRDCAGIRNAAARVGAYGGVTNAVLAPAQIKSTHNTGVAIEMIVNGTNTRSDYSTCPSMDVKVGDRIVVTTQVYYEPIVPLVPLPSFTIYHTSVRSILRNVDLEKINPEAPPAADTYGVQLSVPSNSQIGASGTNVTYQLSVKNTGTILDTYTLTLAGNAWTTTLENLVSVPPGETVIRQVVVSVPPNSAHGASDTVTITAVSLGDPAAPPASDSLSLTTSAPTYKVLLSTKNNSKGCAPGASVIFDVSIRNAGNIDDTYTLSASGNKWPTTLISTISVSAGATASFQVSVTVPTETGSVLSDSVTITAVSNGDPIKPPASASLVLTTSAPTYGVKLYVPDNTLSGRAGGSISYYISITNTGNVNDTYDLTFSGNTWQATVTSPVSVAAGGTITREVKISIPLAVSHGMTDTVTVTATSTGDPRTPKASASLSLTTTALTYGVNLWVSDNTLMGDAGTTVIYDLNIKNTGTVDDSYTLTLSGNTWSTTLDATVAVTAGMTVSRPVAVSIPAAATSGKSDRVTITATSLGDPLTPPVSTSLSLVTTVSTYGVRLTLTVPDDSLSGAPGNPVKYTLTVQNIGNVPDTYEVTASGNKWTTTITPTSVSLAPGASFTTLEVSVAIPSAALHDEKDVVTITAYSGNPLTPRASASLPLTTTATRVCPYAGSLGLGTKSMNLLLYNNSTGADNVTIEQIDVKWYVNSSSQYINYLTFLGRYIVDTDVYGTVNTNPTTSFPTAGPWLGDQTYRQLPAGASNFGLNIYFGSNIDTTKPHGIYIRFNNGCYISR